MARRPFWTAAFIRLLSIAVLCLGPIVAARDDGGSDEHQTAGEHPSADSTVLSSNTSATSHSTTTRVVSIFYIDERAYEGLPYTLFHRDSGAVLGVDTAADVTTFVITTTRGDRRPKPTHGRTDNVTTGITTLESRPTRLRGTGKPSTITQGPRTFEFTGARFGGENHTVVNRCELNGTATASCNLTHVGSIWYTDDLEWNGTYSTYSYNWTSGDRLGFAPVTITAGVELMPPPSSSETPTSTNAAAGAGGLPRRRQGRGAPGSEAGGLGANWWAAGCMWLDYGMPALFPAFVLALAIAL